MQASIVLRHGGESDRAFVLDLGHRTALDSVSTLRTPPQGLLDLSYDRLIDFAFERSYVLVIAETALEGPLGFLLMLDDVPDEVTALPQGFIAYMAVEPDARRRGVAALLLGAAEDAARGRGLPFMALMVTEDNVAARELYAQAGYATERRLLCKTL
ncbi:MAG: GNAT family N-acetyltransferase [Candidatus Eremiobacteraeota bacterium]|nr:GNAT family N-acetyltransferase [Candidatus Eremiobacteraeota bacterium]